MSLVAEIAAQAQSVAATVRDQRAAVAAAADRLKAGRAALLTATRETSDPRIVGSVAALAAAIDSLEDAAGRLAVADERITGYVTSVLGVAVARQGSRPAQPGRETEPAVPGFVRRIAAGLRVMLPRGRKTVGVLSTADGRTRSKPIWSGRQGPAQGAPGVRTDGRWHLAKTVTEHVEAHAAAIMRRPNGPKDAVLTISKPPCDDVPYGCDRVLPNILPVGARLRVFVIGDDGQPRPWRTYEGSGQWLHQP